jgi:hypothetical protein
MITHGFALYGLARPRPSAASDLAGEAIAS